MLHIKKLTKNSFNFLLNFSIKEYTNDLFNYGEAKDLKRAEALANKEVRKLVPKGLETKNQFMHRVKDDGQTVGWLWYQVIDEGKTGFLLYVFIEPKFRGKGLGKELLKLFEEEVEKRGVSELVLYVFIGNKIAVDLYQKNGWFIVKESGFYDAIKSTRYKMVKKIQSLENGDE